jgi:hypothetical protein
MSMEEFYLLSPADIIPETHVAVFSPHYDDTLFLLGNCQLNWREADIQKQIHVLLLFSRSNYLQGTGLNNFDASLERIKLATGQRLLEDVSCLDELFGPFGYRYELFGEMECFARGKKMADSEMEFPHGMFPDFQELDLQIFCRMKERIKKWAMREDTALVFPMAIKEHIDHFIVREAAVEAAKELGNSAKASFYFQEDKPYGGIATKEELERISRFITENQLMRRVYRAYPKQITDLAFKHYVSQVEEVYRTGIIGRAEALRQAVKAACPCDQLYIYDINHQT